MEYYANYLSKDYKELYSILGDQLFYNPLGLKIYEKKQKNSLIIYDQNIDEMPFDFKKDAQYIAYFLMLKQTNFYNNIKKKIYKFDFKLGYKYYKTFKQLNKMDIKLIIQSQY